MLDVRPLTEQLERDAKKNLNEVPERREEDVAHIREWISRQPHLHSRTDDQFLITFLRGCKFSLERTKEKLDAYYTYRSAIPDIFKNRDPLLPELQEILDKGIQLSLGLDSQGRHVWLLRLGRIDTSKQRAEDVLKAGFMMFEIISMEHDEATIYGQNVIVDFGKCTLAHVAFLPPTTMLKVFTIWQEGYPARPQGHNAFNVPAFFASFINLLRSLCKEKLRKRFHVHSTMETMYQRGMKRVLPKEYGGENDTLENIRVATKMKLESYRDYFLDDEKYGVDESRRPGKPKTQEDLFGMDGSFRKLQVD